MAAKKKIKTHKAKKSDALLERLKSEIQSSKADEGWMKALHSIAGTRNSKLIRPLLLCLPFETLMRKGYMHQALHVIYTAEGMPEYEEELVRTLPQLLATAPSLVLEAIPRVLGSSASFSKFVAAASKGTPEERAAVRKAIEAVEGDSGSQYREQVAAIRLAIARLD